MRGHGRLRDRRVHVPADVRRRLCQRRHVPGRFVQERLRLSASRTSRKQLEMTWSNRLLVALTLASGGLFLAACGGTVEGGGSGNPRPNETHECVYSGKTYADGESFDATDGCNTCTCDHGEVGC